jgi:hypothetical protein
VVVPESEVSRDTVPVSGPDAVNTDLVTDADILGYFRGMFSNVVIGAQAMSYLIMTHRTMTHRTMTHRTMSHCTISMGQYLTGVTEQCQTGKHPWIDVSQDKVHGTMSQRTMFHWTMSMGHCLKGQCLTRQSPWDNVSKDSVHGTMSHQTMSHRTISN